MGRYSKIAVAAIAILTIAGCSSEGGEQAATPSAATPTTAATPAATPVPASTQLAQPFSNPVVPGKPQVTTVATIATPNLIQPTNSTQRAIDIARGRPDPFAQIVAPSVPIMPTTSAPSFRRVVPVLPTLPPRVSSVAESNKSNIRRRSSVISARTQPRIVPINRRVIAKLPPPMTRGRGFTPVLPRVMPQVVPNPSLVSVLPPTPQPELARAVAVTGVVLVGSEPQAIIKVPNEPTSRYVQAGDRLSSGLLVKRIEMNSGSEPVVIFEQFGIEVARMVGEGAAAPATTASVDSAPPAPNTVPTGAS